MSSVALVVIAKAPESGRSKTRLCPPATHDDAAAVADALLRDTLATVAAVPARRRIVALEGEPGPWLPPGFEVQPQCEGDLSKRFAHALTAVGGPALMIGMDTPQIGPELLARAAALLELPGTDAVLARAWDGGWWAFGMRDPDLTACDGVPTSSERTFSAQLALLRARGLHVETDLPELRDVDRFDDALAVATECSGSAFAAALRELLPAPAASA
jgi:glycosyltransferase A (GT-A) superfamily protein (DUF2064 family)